MKAAEGASTGQPGTTASVEAAVHGGISAGAGSTVSTETTANAAGASGDAATAPAATPRRLRLAMVGGGAGAFIGAVHRIAARLDDRYQLVAAALSSDPARAAASAAAIGLDPNRSHADWRELVRVEATRPDGAEVVAIVTPNHLHAPVATACLEAGLHVICEKPLTTSLAEGRALADLAARRGRLLALTHTYSGYPMVRHARELVAAGALGTLRLVQVEYQQDWLATPLERGDPTGQEAGFTTGDNSRSTANPQAAWRTDPARAGPAGCLGDIGTHAWQLASFVTGMRPSQLAAELSTFVPGRRLDDHVQMMLRYPNGARGLLWASQVAAGCENALRLRVFGSEAGLAFDQEHPNELWLTPLGGTARRITRGRAGGGAAARATRIPAGHPEGYLEAFAQLYADAADRILALEAGRAPDPAARLLTTARDGLDGLAFVEAALASHAQDGRWVAIEAV